jgi:calcium/calmodulin-dependent serine protein kinase
MHRAVHRMSGQQYAVKIVDIRKCQQFSEQSAQDLRNEIEICALLKHPFIIELFETFSSDGYCYMVFEL